MNEVAAANAAVNGDRNRGTRGDCRDRASSAWIGLIRLRAQTRTRRINLPKTLVGSKFIKCYISIIYKKSIEID